jgi:outer membrane protein OmpA-like peptidoglycan-associated protein
MISFVFHKTRYLSIVLALSMLLSSCSSLEQMGGGERRGTIIGSSAGGVAGAVIGNKLGGSDGAIIGTLIGSFIGGLVGNRIGRAFDERNNEIQKISKEENTPITTEVIDELNKNERDKYAQSIKSLPVYEQIKKTKNTLIFSSTIPLLFDSGSAIVSKEMYRVYDRIAKVYKKDGVRSVMIVGHADNTGLSENNQVLSEKRAKAIAEIFLNNGYPVSKIYYQGAGDAQPIADNNYEEGRAKNRRVEIVDAPTESGLIYANIMSIGRAKKNIIANKKRIIISKNDVEVNVNNYSANSFPIELKGVVYNGNVLMSSGILSKNNLKGWSLGTFFGKEANASIINHIPGFIDDYYLTSGDLLRIDGKKIDVYKSSDCLNGYYKQPVYSYIGGGFLSIYPVSLLKDSIYPAETSPTVSIYKKYMIGTNAKKDLSVNGIGWVYVSGEYMLYRWKSFDQSMKSSGLVGIDILLKKISNYESDKSKVAEFKSQIYYINNRKLYTSNSIFNVRSSKKPNIKWRL